MSNKAIEALIWVLVYGGMLVASLGLFVRRADAGLGWALVGTGAVTSGAGIALIWIRSRRDD